MAVELLSIVGLILVVAVVLGILIIARLGFRNIAYVVFLSVIGMLLLLLEWLGGRPDDYAGVAMGIALLWFWVSLIFFAVNAASAIWLTFRGQLAKKQLIACALPLLSVVIPLLFSQAAETISQAFVR
jgi:hypothetical protein